MNPFVCGEWQAQFKSSDRDKQLLLLSTKHVRTRFKLHIVRPEINFEMATLSIADVMEFSPPFSTPAPHSYVDWILPPSPCVCAPAGRWISLKMQTVHSVRMLLLAPAHGRLTPDVFILGLPVSGAGNSATPIRPCVGTWRGVRWEEAWPHVRSLLLQDQFLGRNVCTSEQGWYGAGGSVPVQISPGRGTAQAAPRADHCGSTVLTVSFITIFVWLLCSSHIEYKLLTKLVLL